MIKNILGKSKHLAILGVLLQTSAFASPMVLPQVVDFSGVGYKDRKIGETSLLSPIKTTNDSALLFDIKYKQDNQNSEEINLGLVYRTLVTDNLLFGFYNYYDRRNTRYSLAINQWTVGMELLTEKLDFRVNGYLPENKTKTINSGNIIISTEGNKVFGAKDNSNEEHTLPGYDMEVGVPLFSFLPSVDNILDTKFYVAKYRFHRKNIATNDGIRLKVEQKLLKNLFGDPYSHLTLVAGADKEKGKSWDKFIGLDLRIALNTVKNKGKYSKSKMHMRMMSPIVRDVDIKTSTPDSPVIVERFPIFLDDQKIEQIYFVGVSNQADYIGDGTKNKPFSQNQLSQIRAASREANTILIPVEFDLNVGSNQYEKFLDEATQLGIQVRKKARELEFTVNNQKSGIQRSFSNVINIEEKIVNSNVDDIVDTSSTITSPGRVGSRDLENDDQGSEEDDEVADVRVDDVHVLIGSPLNHEHSIEEHYPELENRAEYTKFDYGAVNRSEEVHALTGSRLLYSESLTQELNESDSYTKIDKTDPVNRADDVHIITGSPGVDHSNF
ncbi:MAG: hypothetical protein DGJ47_001006 [Rickettsiaceae bacterium]